MVTLLVTSAAAADLTGSWTGSFNSTGGSGDSGSISVQFTVSGSSLTGTLTVPGSSCIAAGAVISGVVNGKDIQFGAISIGGVPNVISFTGKQVGSNENQLRGTYSVSSPCAPDTGEWALSRISGAILSECPTCAHGTAGQVTPNTIPMWSAAEPPTLTNSLLTQDEDGAIHLGENLTLNATDGAVISHGDGAGVVGHDTQTVGGFIGVFGQVDSDNGAAVFGRAAACEPGNPDIPACSLTGASGVTAGVRGVAFSPRGNAVRGDLQADAPISNGRGVFGTYGLRKNNTINPEATNGIAVYGQNFAGSGATGVRGEAFVACTTAPCPFTVGVYGIVRSNAGTAGIFENTSGGGFILEGYGLNPATGLRQRKFLVAGDGNVFVGGQVFTGGADLAERIDVTEDLVPGDVVEIDPAWAGQFRKSRAASSTLVAGIVSTLPGITLGQGREAAAAVAEDARPRLALAGRVPVNATDEGGAIAVGDLLTSSSTSGHAMRCRDRLACTGAIIGKALEALPSGKGRILVLVTLQ